MNDNELDKDGKTMLAMLHWFPMMIPNAAIDRVYDRLDSTEKAVLTQIRDSKGLGNSLTVTNLVMFSPIAALFPALNKFLTQTMLDKAVGEGVTKNIAKELAEVQKEIMAERKQGKRDPYNGSPRLHGFFQRSIVEIFPGRGSFNKAAKEAALDQLGSDEARRVRFVSRQRAWHGGFAGLFTMLGGPAGAVIGGIAFAAGEAQISRNDRELVSQYRRYLAEEMGGKPPTSPRNPRNKPPKGGGGSPGGPSWPGSGVGKSDGPKWPGSNIMGDDSFKRNFSPAHKLIRGGNEPKGPKTPKL